ncbi:hypothetical protein VIGAN_02332300 [Vigna angularis var. angularis]|uniref:Uncharacterized protein n=1 Tax=Vigna angularis var. angularis TaxID=157739 RepID=A0A0S3RI57_PHAAN|nr:hypothetical protein VIGAN_02332300 [Vigna angularis var. angularis]
MALSHYHYKHILIWLRFLFHLRSSMSPTKSYHITLKTSRQGFLLFFSFIRLVILQTYESCTSERVASAMRHRMKQKRPIRIVRTIRKAPVLLLKSVFLLLG